VAGLLAYFLGSQGVGDAMFLPEILRERDYLNGADFNPKLFMLTILGNCKVYPYTGQKMIDKRFLFL
jgi:hypothetical protein